MTYKILPDTETQIKYVSYTISGVEYKIAPSLEDGALRHLTEQEALAKATQQKTWVEETATRKLKVIKQIRLEKLIETDFLAMSDNVLSDDMKNFRKKMRDIPQDFDSSKYDELLNRDSDGKLTHSIWSKP